MSQDSQEETAPQVAVVTNFVGTITEAYKAARRAGVSRDALLKTLLGMAAGLGLERNMAAIDFVNEAGVAYEHAKRELTAQLAGGRHDLN